MSRPQQFIVFASVAALTWSAAYSQKSAADDAHSSLPTGSVTGSVYDGETRLPVRFAEIHLVAVPTAANLLTDQTRATAPDAVPEQVKRVQSVSGTSDMNGGFRIEGVPSGDYLVTALELGYITPGATAAMDWTLSEDQIKSIVTSLQHVHVVPEQAASVSLTTHRGAVISGRIQFMDGSPAIGMQVGCGPVESNMPPANLRSKPMSPLRQALLSSA